MKAGPQVSSGVTGHSTGIRRPPVLFLWFTGTRPVSFVVLGVAASPVFAANEHRQEKEMAEQTFLEDRGVTVTSARFITGGQTYALNNITSVKQGMVPFDGRCH